MSGLQKVRFRQRETLPFGGLLLRFGTLETGERTWSVVAPGFEDAAPLRCGFWGPDTVEELEEIARAMRHALRKERDNAVANAKPGR